ncbi:MAG: hypothetical protein Q8L13_11770 [Bradyrhizobium sp.]|uniref:phage tail assembly chaperone n=1 Tax=Bradyrhizobium sp. TaxID=376 RepID=UPI00272FDE00|nr:hypothetical protein [Bradyrhizobium sp.]MDP1867003.1 hypothetical protein [Bradyrhizobium sp.]
MLEGLIRRTNKPERLAKYQADLACPPLPRSVAYIWRIFNRLRRRKGSNGFAMSPIEWPDIDAFVRHSGMPLTPWEIGLIEDLDDLFLKTRKPDDEETETS